MNIRVNNLGPLRQADFELADLTIICGANNSGKTYATYALYGFLIFWWERYVLNIYPKYSIQLAREGATEIDIDQYVDEAQGILSRSCKFYTEQLSSVFASPKKNFITSSFTIDINPSDILLAEAFEKTVRAPEAELFSILWNPGERLLNVSLLVDKENLRVSRSSIDRRIGSALKDIIFGRLLPRPFIASAERTGAAIFRKELNFARNRLLEQMNLMDKETDAFDLLTKAYSDYALPVTRNVDFTRDLENITKNESFLMTDHPDIIEEFSNIIGGEYTVKRNGELYYIPKSKKVRLTLDESSSSVRSLLDIGFYLRHVASVGDLLLVDEPELNLHPENQRLVARLFARLVNISPLKKSI